MRTKRLGNCVQVSGWAIKRHPRPVSLDLAALSNVSQAGNYPRPIPVAAIGLGKLLIQDHGSAGPRCVSNSGRHTPKIGNAFSQLFLPFPAFSQLFLPFQRLKAVFYSKCAFTVREAMFHQIFIPVFGPFGSKSAEIHLLGLWTFPGKFGMCMDISWKNAKARNQMGQKLWT